jgi:hypothetical protein
MFDFYIFVDSLYEMRWFWQLITGTVLTFFLLSCIFICIRLISSYSHILLITQFDVIFIRKNTEALLIASKEIGLEVNAEETKYMVMSRDQNPGQNGYIQIGNESFKTVEQFKYLGTTLTNKNSIH